MEGLAKRAAAAALEKVIADTRESRSIDQIMRSVAIALAATAVFVGLLWALGRVRKFSQAKLVGLGMRHARRLDIGGVEDVLQDRVADMVLFALFALYWGIAFLLAYEWISLVLAQFPYTRTWGEQLNGFLIGVVVRLAGAIVGAVPDLITAAVIFLLARFVDKFVCNFFERVAAGQIKLPWLDADLATPTRRLCRLALWLFALAMAYPYPPGAQTEAFKGISVMVGLMISLGASGLFGQAVSGLILTYTRVFRNGEYVRIAEHEGTVTELRLFATRIRTGLGEELSLPNTLILSSATKNYSRAVVGAGFVLDTTVTIGYDTPWRQVSAMLVEAALRTPGVLTEPAPQAFQTALSDFYPEYRLVCQAFPEGARPRAEVLSTLHSNIQDVFNEYGVQIMSPHYYLDPAQAKIVPKENWFLAPAKRPPE